MKQFSKKYQVWHDSNYIEGSQNIYGYQEFDTLEECVNTLKTGEFYITKRVLLNVTDAEEQLPVITSVPIYDQNKLPEEVRSDEEDPILDRYMGGATGTVTTD
jgi:hypothetical protein